MPRKKQKSGPSPRTNTTTGTAHRAGGGSAAKSGSVPGGHQMKTKASVSTSTKLGNGGAGGGQKKQSLQTNQRPIVPFLKEDRILLVGEGDFSFARSLAKQYKCRKLCATCYDSKETLFSKYPQAEQHIQEILDSATSKSKKTDQENAHDEKDQQTSSQSQSQTQSSSTQKPAPKVLFSVDAQRKIPAWKLAQQAQAQAQAQARAQSSGSAAYELRMSLSGGGGGGGGGPWDVICFNFPHVGGLSTDVNRQVRANQELLVSFFQACVPLLSKAPPPVDEDDEEEEWGEDEEDEEEDDSESFDFENKETSGKGMRTGPGQILVSLFEGEPYTLWNIKDLARHAGLQVVTSFKFPWTEYEGYSHARTLGKWKGKMGGRVWWRGEDRLARMYVFEVRQEESQGRRVRREVEMAIGVGVMVRNFQNLYALSGKGSPPQMRMVERL
ncbi:hypothetical protein POX_e06324 [Penicillium oxalicum]|uniref:hypothetical protein n=1 Tax=Penicillium oxalicum TaxID=69781 RepID=UPI0020B68076|nr:hypothetical protein POX_e06324 [Penicillium oxalicum]KAI2788310.1 hypothetical protein POX_e06324 [Penicillium oxalicum]